MTAADLFLAPIVFNFPAIPGLKEIGEASPNIARWMREMVGPAEHAGDRAGADPARAA